MNIIISTRIAKCLCYFTVSEKQAKSAIRGHGCTNRGHGSANRECGDANRGPWDRKGGARGWEHGAGHGSNREADYHENFIEQEPLYNYCIIVHQHHPHC